MGVEAKRWRWRTSQNGVENNSGRISAEGHGAGGHLIEHGAEREQVGAGVKIFAARLLGRHIGHGADGRSGAGQERLVDSSGGTDGGGRKKGKVGGMPWPNQKEKLWLVAGGDHKICRLFVSVGEFPVPGRRDQVLRIAFP